QMDSEKVSLAIELLQLCLLPELITDIDSQLVEPEHFKEFKRHLDENLHLLFDLLQQHEECLFVNATETQTFRKYFVLMLCEQSAENALHRTDDLMVQQNIAHLIEKWFRKIVSEKSVLELVLQHYKMCIKVDVWKKNIGAIFGFHRFCQLNYKSNNELKITEIFFVLATGTLLSEHYEPQYKQLGIDLFNIMMTFSNKSDILTANIHHAVYATCSLNIPKIQDHKCSVELWKCLYKCLEIDVSWKRTSDWHKVDQLMMDLLRSIAFEGNLSRSTILFYFAAQFAALPSGKKSLLGALNHLSRGDNKNGESVPKVDWSLLRREYREIDSFIVYKWVKKMLLLIGNQNMFCGDSFEVACNLQAIHLTYIIWIFSIPLVLVSSPILDMLTKLVPSLLECYKRYKTDQSVSEVVDEIRELFTTFLEHFGTAGISGKHVKLERRFETLKLIKDAIG
ncbi:hypothetical protein Bhyg_16816, partial [Pseudolycoriella hygida]